MVRNHYYFTLLILIWVQKSADAINFKDIHDINSIKKFIQGITDRTPAEYNLGQALSNSEKSKIIIDDLVGLLNNLNDLVDNTSNVTKDFVDSLKVFNQRPSEQRNQTVLKFMDLLRGFDNITNRINSHSDNLINLRYDFGYNLVKYCSAVLNLTRSIVLEGKEDILNKHQHIEELWWQIYQQDTNMPFSINLFSTPCGKRLLVEQLHYKFYRQMVTFYLKEYVIRYYLDIINSQCPHHNLTNTRMDKFVFMRKMQEKITPMFHRHSNFDFIYRCDPPNYDNNDGETYYELSKMQTVIIKEEDLDLYRSCSHNCNLWYIRDSTNFTECDEYQECRYVDSSYEICEPPASDHSPRRYQWFKDEHGNVYGDNSTECKTPVKKVSSTLWASKLRSSDYCQCNCIKRNVSREDDVLFVSFREQVTDIEKNTVIVGVRFVKKNNMIHVQIKKAKLKPNGLTEKSRWKELEDFSYNKSTGSFYVRHFNGSQILLKEDIDYGRPI